MSQASTTHFIRDTVDYDFHGRSLSGTNAPMLKALEKSGFYGYQAAIPGYYPIVKKAVKDTLDDHVDPRDKPLANSNSLITADIATPTRNTQTLFIDCGGTNTKASIRTVDADGNVTKKNIFEVKNEHLDDRSASDPLDRYMDEIFKRVKAANVLDGKTLAMAVIWSNGADVQELDPNQSFGIHGRTLYVTGKAAGTAYNKKEFFVENLRDGDDIGNMFIASAVTKHGLPVRFLVPGNDTAFTAAAGLGSEQAKTSPILAGMIASSGANITLLSKNSFYNPEMGGHVKLDKHVLTKYEQQFFGFLAEDPTKGHVNIEHLMAGKWLAKLFTENLAGLITDADSDETALPQAGLKQLLHAINTYKSPDGEPFSNKQLSKLASPQEAYQNHEWEKMHENTKELGASLSKDECLVVMEMLEVLEDRAALLASVMAYGGIANHIEDEAWNERSPRSIVLDSTMANYPNFLEKTTKALRHTLGSHKPITFLYLTAENLETGGSMSVPTIGAAVAADQIMAGRLGLSASL